MFFGKEQDMQRANPFDWNGKVSLARAVRGADGLVEITVLSLAGLAMTLILIAQNSGSDALQLMFSQ
jgi:hypothetical protein